MNTEKDRFIIIASLISGAQEKKLTQWDMLRNIQNKVGDGNNRNKRRQGILLTNTTSQLNEWYAEVEKLKN